MRRSSTRSRNGRVILAVIIVVCHIAMLGWSSVSNGPVWHEPAQLASGVAIWSFGRFDVAQVNPPLVRGLAALPVLALQPELDPEVFDRPHQGRDEFCRAERFIGDNAEMLPREFLVARLTCILFSLVGACFCWKTANLLFGAQAAVVSLLLWCFSPWILGHGATIMCDVPAGAGGCAAVYFFVRWLRRSEWLDAAIAGVVFGLAVLCKFTLLAWYPLFVVMWPLYRIWNWRQASFSDWSRQALQLTTILAISIYVVNCAYVFEGTFTPLKNIRFQAALFGGGDHSSSAHRTAANRVAASLGEMPIPLPTNMIEGIDAQRYDFERGMASYVRGKWADRGWWYYYLYSLEVKMPLGTWGLLFLASFATLFLKGYNATWRDEMLVVVPTIVILGFVSSQNWISQHSRYIIPALPFLFAWVGKLGRSFKPEQYADSPRITIVIRVLVVLLLNWTIASSIAVYPHSLSYFNEVVGGPRNGGAHLLSSNIDWGQDLFYLKAWLDKHPDVRLDGLAFYGSYPVTLAGIPSTPLPPSGDAAHGANRGPGGAGDDYGPKPGWYALSVNYLYSRDGVYRYFLEFEPVASAGYSIYIYHITSADAARAGPSPRARFRERDTPMNSPLRKETLPAMATDRPCQTKRR